MAAKGAIAKEQITKKILETFPNSFIYDKLIRIPFNEDGNQVEIKVTLTAAKDLVGDEESGVINFENSNTDMADFMPTPVNVEYTEQENKNVEDLLKALNL